MSGLFGDGGARASAEASERQLAMQREQLDRQEAQQKKEESDLAKRTQATLRARQRGGQRMLLSDMDDRSTLG